MFEREEIKFHTYDDILDYLSEDGKRNKTSYKNTAIILAEPLVIKEDIQDANTLDDIKEVKKDISSIQISNARTELNQLVNQRKRELLITEKEVEKAEKPVITEAVKEAEKEEKRKNKTRKIMSNFREQLKEAPTKYEIDYILNKAEKELGTGKNYDSLEEAGDYLKSRIDERLARQKEEIEQAKRRKEELREQGIEPDIG